MSRERPNNRRQNVPIDFEHNGHTYHGRAGLYSDGRYCDVFLTAGKTGTDLQVATADAAIAASLALQAGIAPETLASAFLQGENGEPAGALGKMFSILTGGKDGRHKR